MTLHFLGSSWATFVPDLIVGVLTGAVVGAAFYAYERGAEGRRQRHDARVVSSRIVQPLLLVLQRPEHLSSYESVVPIPRKLVRALSIVEQADVDLWHETSPSELTKRLCASEVPHGISGKTPTTWIRQFVVGGLCTNAKRALSTMGLRRYWARQDNFWKKSSQTQPGGNG